MNISKNVAQLRREYVEFELEGIDRMCLNLYLPQVEQRLGSGGLFPRLQGAPVRLDPGGGGHEQCLSPGGARIRPAQRHPDDPF